MRSFRSTRNSAVRFTAVAATGIIAMSALTGCLGKDDKKASNTSSSSSPSASGDATDKPTDGPTGKSTSTKKPNSTANPSSGATSDSVNRIELKVGDCVNYEGEKMSKASCSSPHDEETGAVYTLPSSMTPTSMTYMDDIEAKCEELLTPVINRQPNAKDLTFSYVYPTASSWMMDNDRTLQCMVAREDKQKLTAKLK